jgi:beta-hydroxyacyl-ACP dehydratase FabZ
MAKDIQEILKILPHRYPFLLVDRIIENSDDGKQVVGLKNVTVNEPYFQGHFPGRPVMPGVLQIEAMAQVAGFLMLKRVSTKNKIPYLMTIDKVKFRHPVIPGDQLKIEVTVLNLKERVGRFKCQAYVNEKVVTEAELSFILSDIGGK